MTKIGNSPDYKSVCYVMYFIVNIFSTQKHSETFIRDTHNVFLLYKR